MARAYFRLFYDQYLPLMSRLSFEEAGRLFVGTLRYLKEEIEPDLPGAEGIVWPLLKEDIDRDKQAYEVTCARNAANSRKKQEKQSDTHPEPVGTTGRQSKESKKSNQANKSNKSHQAYQAEKAAAVEAVERAKETPEDYMARMQNLLRLMSCEEIDSFDQIMENHDRT